jgi:hypothetical protein
MHHIYNMADEKDNPCAGMAETPDASRAATAAAYVCRGSGHGTGQHAGTAEIDRQAQRLSEWAKISGAVVFPDYFTGLERISTTTAEHEVFFRPADDRYIKRTYPGTFGVTPETKGRQKAASPAFYLQRIIHKGPFDRPMCGIRTPTKRKLPTSCGLWDLNPSRGHITVGNAQPMACVCSTHGWITSFCPKTARCRLTLSCP